MNFLKEGKSQGVVLTEVDTVEKVMVPTQVPITTNCCYYTSIPEIFNPNIFKVSFLKSCILESEEKPCGSIFHSINTIRQARPSVGGSLRKCTEIAYRPDVVQACIYFSAPLYTFTNNSEFLPWVYEDEFAIKLVSKISDEDDKGKGYIITRRTLDNIMLSMPEVRPINKEGVKKMYAIPLCQDDYFIRKVVGFSYKKPSVSDGAIYFTLKVGEKSNYVYDIRDYNHNSINSLKINHIRVYQGDLLPTRYQVK